jgi:hypothetical protein
MIRALVIALALVLGTHAVSFATAHGRRFESWDDAVNALVSAVRAGDRTALVAILGRDARSLVSSGDDVQDRQRFQQFVSAYDEKHWLEGGGGRVRLYVGEDDFPFPIPLVPDGPWWRWDAAAGRDEMLGRRIGRNELNALQACLAYVDAQREYFAEDRDGNDLLEYAQRIRSRPGMRDGLYWETRPGAPPSPLGPLVAQARSEGYRAREAGPAPYHGYLFRILTAQGPDAADGAYDYIVNGRMIGGFALVAFPARYGDSGVMTFIVSHDGVIYQKNLGADTARVAGAMTSFNPDRSWDRITFTTAQR